MKLLFSLTWLFGLTLSVLAQDESRFYRFAVDQDGLRGAPDFGFLNHSLTATDRVFVRDGHFFRVGTDLQPNTDDDERVRLFGVNLAFGANLPFVDTARGIDDAVRVAKRLRRLGVNLVRLHLLDDNLNPWLGTLLKLEETLPDGTRKPLPFPTFDALEVARLRHLLDALRAEGIYVNLGLHVAYQFRPAVDGVPALPGCETMPPASKPLHSFYPAMVAAQQQYARELLTQLRLADDPVLALVELDNESSPLEAWQTGNFDRVVQGAYRAELQQQWNQFLTAKYATTEALRTAWGGSSNEGDELLPRSGKDEPPLRGWRFETNMENGATGVVSLNEIDGVPELRANATAVRPGAQAYVKPTGFSLQAGQSYVAEIELRAELPAGQCRNVDWSVMEDGKVGEQGWRPVFWRTLSLNNEWRKFTVSFTPPFAINDIGRFVLFLQSAVNTPIQARRWSLRPAAPRGLTEAENLEAANVALGGEFDSATGARREDFLLFLAEVHRRFLRGLQQTIRAEAGRLVPVTGTQMNYGGLLNLDSHAEMDYLDSHLYIDYHAFPDGQGSGVNWFISDVASTRFGFRSFRNFALMREAGRPYTISEFNQPWPNTYGAEMDPALAVFAAFQDWDAVMHFAYSHGRQWDNGVPNGFNLDGDWTKWVSFGQAAWLFRTGVIRAGETPLEIPVNQALRLQAGREKRNGDFREFLETTLGLQSHHALLHPVRLVREEGRTLPEWAGPHAAICF